MVIYVTEGNTPIMWTHHFKGTARVWNYCAIRVWSRSLSVRSHIQSRKKIGNTRNAYSSWHFRREVLFWLISTIERLYYCQGRKQNDYKSIHGNKVQYGTLTNDNLIQQIATSISWLQSWDAMLAHPFWQSGAWWHRNKNPNAGWIKSIPKTVASANRLSLPSDMFSSV